MEKNIITEVNEYCARAGISPATIGVRVLENSRLMERLDRRIKLTERDTSLLRAYMTAHPVEVK